jgi:hypothetical protein
VKDRSKSKYNTFICDIFPIVGMFEETMGRGKAEQMIESE